MFVRHLFGLRYLLLPGLLGVAACAKTGEPQPPQVFVPKPAVDLSARQYNERILLTFSLPVENTNGSRAARPERVEIFRLPSNSREDSGPLSEASFLMRAVPVRSLTAGELAAYPVDSLQSYWDDPAAQDPAALLGQGFRYAVRFINNKNQTAGLSNQVFLAPIAIPPAPQRISCEVVRDAIRLTWQPPVTNFDGSVPARISGYNLYRSEDPKNFPIMPLNAELLSNPGFDDHNFEYDKTYYYAVSVVGSRANPYAESSPAVPLAVTPRDVFPPDPVKNLVAVVENGIVTVMWGPADDSDAAGYRVYRRVEGAGERTLVSNQPLMALSYRDDRVRPGDKYEYIVVVVDTHGNESPAVTATVEIK